MHPTLFTATEVSNNANNTARFHCVVTRHHGAAQWVQSQLGHAVRTVVHLEAQAIEVGGRYYGVFPLHLAAAICAAGSECWAITFNMPLASRGQELSAAQLDALGAQLVRHEVSAVATALQRSGAVAA